MPQAHPRAGASSRRRQPWWPQPTAAAPTPTCSSSKSSPAGGCVSSSHTHMSYWLTGRRNLRQRQHRGLKSPWAEAEAGN